MKYVSLNVHIFAVTSGEACFPKLLLYIINKRQKTFFSRIRAKYAIFSSTADDASIIALRTVYQHYIHLQHQTSNTVDV